jgi:protein involved in polysaccharide export with SLBB domain
MAKKTTAPPCLLVALLLSSLAFAALPAAAWAQAMLEEKKEAPTTAIDIPIAPVEDEVMGVGRSATTPGETNLPLEEPLDPNLYICGSGDSFELRFWGTQNMSIRLTTDLEGNAFIPKVGKVRVAGQTLTQARARVLGAVRRFYPGLKSDVSLVKARQFVVHVVGDVKKPGLYQSNARRRVSSVIGEAGGTTGSIRRIQIRRRTGATATADLLLYSRTGETRYNPYLLDGDVVRVPKTGVMVTIAGPVRDPGSYELIASRDMAELLELAGGFKSSASRGLPIRITRRNRNERETAMELRFTRDGGVPNTRLRDDDEIFVPSTGEIQRSVALIGAVVGADPADPATTIKRLSYVEGDTVRSLIERAGGVTVGADLQNAYIRHDREPIRPIDLDALLMRRDFRADRPVRIGDSIVVPFKQRSVLVEGAVVRAGAFQFNPRFGVREYLANAGGTSRNAQDEDEIRLIGADGKMRPFSEALKVRPGDTIVVPERNFSRSEIVQLIMSGAGLVLSGAALAYAVSR